PRLRRPRSATHTTGSCLSESPRGSRGRGRSLGARLGQWCRGQAALVVSAGRSLLELHVAVGHGLPGCRHQLPSWRVARQSVNRTARSSPQTTACFIGRSGLPPVRVVMEVAEGTFLRGQAFMLDDVEDLVAGADGFDEPAHDSDVVLGKEDGVVLVLEEMME